MAAGNATTAAAAAAAAAASPTAADAGRELLQRQHSAAGSSTAGCRGGFLAAGGMSQPGECQVIAATRQPKGRSSGERAAAELRAHADRWQQPQNQHPLWAYIMAWRLRRFAEAASAAAVAPEPQAELVSSRPAVVNADIAVCQAELAALLRREQSSKRNS